MDYRDDETLSAYLDGELTTDELRTFERRLETDTALQARLSMMREADAATREVFAAVDAAPMPEAVMELLKRAPATGGDNVVAFPQRGLDRFMQVPVAIAAGVALVVGFLVSDVFQQLPGRADSIQSLSAQAIDADSSLHRLLEERRSGEIMSLADGQEAEVLLSFEDPQNARFCRQFRVDNADSAAHAVACREAGNWNIEALAFADAAPGGQFAPASAGIPFTISGTVDQLIGSTEPLGIEEENRVISGSWKKSQ